MITELSQKDQILESLSAVPHENESAQATAVRENAKEALGNLEFPTSKVEYWKYTRLGKIINKAYHIQEAEEDLDISPFVIPNLDAHLVVMVNGLFQKNLSVIKDDEITVLSMQNVTKDETAFEQHFGHYANTKDEIFIALNNFGYQGGVFVLAKKNVVAQKPVHIINAVTGNNTISQTRNLIVAEQNAAVKVIESFVNIDTNQSFSNPLTEIFVGENAHVEYNKIQDKWGESYQVATEQVHQEANSTFTINTISLKGTLLRNNLNIVVDAEGCETNLNGIYLGIENDHIDNHTIVDHQKPNCNSNEVYKGILNDNSTGVFNGKVFVRRDAQKTNAFQQNNNILLTDDATVNSKPELEIYADDVKCSHGSTIGQLDEEALFYLQARGISRKSATNLLINAFAEDALEKISIDALKELITAVFAKRFES